MPGTPPGTGLVVRAAETDELEAVGALTVAAYEEFTLGEGDPYLARLRDAASRAREAELYVACAPDPSGAGERLVGTVTVCPPGSPWREIARDDEGEFRMLAVAPSARGRGVGDALVAFCLDLFRARGARGVALSSLVEMHAAHRLYERYGFERRPERDWRPLPHVPLLAFEVRL